MNILSLRKNRVDSGTPLVRITTITTRDHPCPSTTTSASSAPSTMQANFRPQPSLEELAASAGLSAFHFQRLFRRWAGIRPKCYAQYLTADYGAGRLHDLLINIHGVSPGELRRRGAQLDVRMACTPAGSAIAYWPPRHAACVDWHS